MSPKHCLAAAAVAAACALPSTALAADLPTALPPVERTLVAATGAQNDCTSKPLSGTGVARTTYTAPMSGFVTVRSAGSDTSDWDLGLFDAASGRELSGSQGFGSHEVTQSWVTAGQQLLIQGCRESGDASTLGVAIRFVDAVQEAATKASVIRVPYPNPATIRWFDDNGFDVTHSERRSYVDVLVPSAAMLDLVKEAGIPYETLVADLGKQDLQARQADVAYKKSVAAAGSPLPTGRSTYRTPDDYPKELKQIVAQFPAIARPVVIGHTFQGREMQGVELSNNVAAKDDGKPVFFLVGTHHAREWPSAEIALEYAWMLAKGYGNDTQITNLLKTERIVVVPVINADGFAASRGTAEDGFVPDPYDSTGVPLGDTVEGVVLPFGGNLAYRRKNCDGPVPSLGGAERDYPCYYQWGVDPNRNYGEGWGGPGASPDPNTQVYRGDDQWSEPETQAVHEYSQTHPVTAIISLHNVAALVLRPPGLHTAGKAPDEDMLRELGDAMADATGYTSQYGFELYDTSGTTEDWNYAAQGSLGYTIEIGPEGGQFHMPYETGVVEQWLGPHENPDDPNSPRKGGMRLALLEAAAAAADPAKHSIVEGKAPAGRVLTLSKSFETKSSPVCTLAQGYVRAGTIPPADCIAPGEQRSQADKLEYTTVVPKSGRFSWHVTPSTRPFVGGRYVEGEDTNRVTTFTGDGQGSAPAPGETKEYGFDVPASDYTRNLDVKLSWTGPDDYDIDLYYVDSAGKRNGIGEGQVVDGVLVWTQPGHGENPPGTPEHIVVTAPPAGHYVAAVHNIQGTLNDYTLTATATGQLPGHAESTGKTESFDLTCSLPNGTPVSTRHGVVVGRGGRLTVNFDSKSC
jgi:murein tripeptide amidase MpaA